MEGKLSAVPTQREYQRVSTRNRLFDLCVDEFRRVGVEKTRIRDVVEHAGVVPGTFYFHFPSKTHVLLELGNRFINQVADQLPTPPIDLGAFLDALVEAAIAAEEQIGDGALFRAVVSSFQNPPDDVSLESMRIQIALRDCIAAQATRSGEGELSADELSVLILTAFFGALLVGPAGPGERAAQLRRIVRFLARALENSDSEIPVCADPEPAIASTAPRTNQGEGH